MKLMNTNWHFKNFCNSTNTQTLTFFIDHTVESAEASVGVFIVGFEY